eukprot:CAMPEP_0115278114 /NCGR_PEP_ID=MMETSP0270-20121206/57590_1 /TAXON_ID=71861 /ORGANISM="Scrippsiella trochoidea, Strain CCMP3099" /LENGTH=273 /DNA_ID=CAMNT_0002694779 /DNA_START=273 /DNA_END=1091 /DNA_ORIENTATION=-
MEKRLRQLHEVLTAIEDELAHLGRGEGYQHDHRTGMSELRDRTAEHAAADGDAHAHARSLLVLVGERRALAAGRRLVVEARLQEVRVEAVRVAGRVLGILDALEDALHSAVLRRGGHRQQGRLPPDLGAHVAHRDRAAGPPGPLPLLGLLRRRHAAAATETVLPSGALVAPAKWLWPRSSSTASTLNSSVSLKSCMRLPIDGRIGEASTRSLRCSCRGAPSKRNAGRSSTQELSSKSLHALNATPMIVLSPGGRRPAGACCWHPTASARARFG